MKRQRISLTAMLALCVSLAQGADSPDMADTGAIEYSSVAEALAALKAKPGVQFSTDNGMTVAKDLDAPHPAVWIFYPASHPAYPTVIKRSVVNHANGAYMDTSVKCEASQEVCDKYFAGMK
jgi:hypothetical protein